MQWLLHMLGRPLHPDGLFHVAIGCDLPTLQRLYREWPAAANARAITQWPEVILEETARSPTPDWRAKMEWLEDQGHGRTVVACMRAVRCPDALERLTWLHGRGYPVTSPDVVMIAVATGKLDVLEYLVSEGAEPDERAASCAAGEGRLELLQALHAAGCPVDAAEAVWDAAMQGHLHVVAWLVEALGLDATQLQTRVFRAAAGSGSVQLLAWLRERGCPWDAGVLNCAALGGCAEAIEWLMERGCPMQDDGEPYKDAVRNGDLATLRLLRRLGCPWGPHGELLEYVAWARHEDPLPVVRCLLEAGCPVDWANFQRAVRKRVDADNRIVGQLNALVPEGEAR